MNFASSVSGSEGWLVRKSKDSENFSVNTENNFQRFVPDTVVIQKIPEKKPQKVLISKVLTRKINPEIQSAVAIQKFFRMHLAQEKYKIMRLQAFRNVSLKLIGKGGKILEGVPVYILIFRCRRNFFIKVKNLSTNHLFYTDITPKDYIFGYIKTQSCKRICRCLALHNGLPVFKYNKRSSSSIDLNTTLFYKFHKCSESISLHQATWRIQSLFKTMKIRNEFVLSKERNFFHSKLVLDNREYRAAVQLKKTFLFFEIYLLTRPKNGKWVHTFRLENKDLIQKYGEINPSVIVKDLRMRDGKICIGIQSSKQDFQMQKHESYIFSEVLMEEKFLSKANSKMLVVDTYLRTYKNKFLETTYQVLHFECYQPVPYSPSRCISIHLSTASEILGIPLLWIHPISYFIRSRCLVLSFDLISLNLRNKKVDLNQMASKIQKNFKKYLKTKSKRPKTTSKKKTLRYRISLLIKK